MRRDRRGAPTTRRAGHLSGWTVAVSATVAAACGRIDYEPASQLVNDGAVDAATDAGALALFGPPRPVLGLDGIGSYDDPTFTTDGLLLVFNRDSDIWSASRSSASDPFGEGVLVSELSTAEYETSPEIAGDGLTIWFARRPETASHDIWVATRASRTAPWDPPTPVAELNTSVVDTSPTPSTDLTWLTFARARDIFLARRSSTTDPWTDLGAIPSLVSAEDDGGAMLARGATTILFDSERPGAGLGDIWMAERADTSSPFGPPRPVEELNTAGDEGDPWVSEDARHIIFMRNSQMFEAER